MPSNIYDYFKQMESFFSNTPTAGIQNYINSLDLFVESFKNKGKPNKKKNKRNVGNPNKKDKEDVDEDEDNADEEEDNVDEEDDVDKEEDVDDEGNANDETEDVDNDEDDANEDEPEDVDNDEGNANEDVAEEDDQIEGFKNKNKKKTKAEKKTRKNMPKISVENKIPQKPLFISILENAGATPNDIAIVKTVLGTFFHLFLAFYMSYSWYYNWFVDKPDPSILSHFAWLQSNAITDFLSQYAVLLIEKLHQILFTVFPNVFDFVKMASHGFLGNRFILFTIFAACYGIVPPLLDKITDTINSLQRKFTNIYQKIQLGAKPKVVIKTLLDDVIKLINSISGNILAPIMGFLYLTVYVENLVADDRKGILENVFTVIPSFFTKLVGGSVLYIIWLFFKFALLFMPSTNIAVFVATLVFLYYSFFRMWKNGGSMFDINNSINILAGNNDGATSFHKVFFDEQPITDTFGQTINGFEKCIAWVAYMFPYLVFIFGMLKPLFSLYNIDNLYLFIAILIGILVLIITLVTYALNTFGFANTVTEQVAQDAKTFSLSGMFSNNASDTTANLWEQLRQNAKQIVEQQKQMHI